MLKKHRYIIGKIYAVAGLSLFLLVSSFYFFGFKPLSDRLHTEHVLEIDYALSSKLWLIQSEHIQNIDISRQTGSRTAIRDKQVAYLRGKISLEKLAAFAAPKLADAMNANEGIAGISRFDPTGKLLFGIGEQLPDGIAAGCNIPRLDKIIMLNPSQIAGARRLFYCSPIIAPGFGRAGADILVMKEDAFQRVIDIPLSGAVKNMVVCLVSENRILYWPNTQSETHTRSVLEKYLEAGVTDNGYLIRSKEMKNNGWKLYAAIDQDLYFADISHQLFMLLSVIGGVAALLFVLTVAVLRPIIGSLLTEQKLIELSTHDGLTGLYNHAYMEESLSRELAITQRYKRPLSLLMFDIDHFKKVNDTYGHLGGDEVLQYLARQLQASARKQDIAARYGGEEFMLILPETGEEAAALMAERLRAEVASSKIMTEAGEIVITISIGVVTCDGSLGDISKHKIMKAVDEALYASKAGGRNRVSVADLQATPG